MSGTEDLAPGVRAMHFDPLSPRWSSEQTARVEESEGDQQLPRGLRQQSLSPSLHGSFSRPPLSWLIQVLNL